MKIGRNAFLLKNARLIRAAAGNNDIIRMMCKNYFKLFFIKLFRKKT